MDFFYDGQIKRYLTQVMRFFSNFSYKDAKGQLVQVPVRFGDMNKQVASIVNKNSENIMQSAPFIAVYIKDLKFDRTRIQDPTFVQSQSFRERAYDSQGKEYLNTQGANYTVEKLMPTPYIITFNVDIWTTSLDQKLQLWEQITVLFNPSIEFQTSDNYIDWSSLSVLELTDNCVFESRTIPQGATNDLSIATLQFTAPAWISTPVKVKKLGIITKIIANVFAEPINTGSSGGYEDAINGSDFFSGSTPVAKIVVTPMDYDLLVLNNVAVLVPAGEQNVSEGWTSVDNVPNRPSWLELLDLYPGKFTSGLSQLRLAKTDGHEIVAYLTLNPTNESLMSLNIDQDTVSTNTSLVGPIITSGTINAIINPQTVNPTSITAGTRYLILEDIGIGTDAWGSTFSASANDIIEYNGTSWVIIFNSITISNTTYITNAYTGIQYKWNGQEWAKSFEGIYDKEKWRLIL